MAKIGFSSKRKAGRPSKSKVRERIIAILREHGPLHGYAIYKIYKEKYGIDTTKRNIYYNIYKGIEENRIIVLGREKKEGFFTWGNESERVIYMLGYNNEDFGELKAKRVLPTVKDVVKNIVNEIEKEVNRFAVMISLNKEERERKYQNIKDKIYKVKNWIQNINYNLDDEINKLNELEIKLEENK